MKLTLGQVADWIHAEGDFNTSAEALGYSIDSRTIGAGDLFFAVKGERLERQCEGSRQPQQPFIRGLPQPMYQTPKKCDRNASRQNCREINTVHFKSIALRVIGVMTESGHGTIGVEPDPLSRVRVYDSARHYSVVSWLRLITIRLQDLFRTRRFFGRNLNRK